MKKVGIFFILFCLSYCIMSAEVNLNITGAGARAAGFGGAFIGIADDATAVAWNPAGLTLLERPEASLVTRFILEDYVTTDLGTSDDWKDSQNHFVMNFISAAYPLNLQERKIILAMAYQRQLDLYTYDSTIEYEEEQTGGVDSFTLGFATKIMPYLSAGLSTNIWMGSTDYDAKSKINTDYIKGESSFSGINFVLGLMFDLNYLDQPKPLKIGMSIKTPFDLSEDYKQDSNIIGYSLDSDNTIEMPFMFGLGASYQFNEKFTLAFDFETRSYGSSKVTEEINGIKTEEKVSEDDLSQIRLGGEYLVITDLGVIPLRLGIQSVPTTYNDINEDNTIGDQVNGGAFCMGTGFITERFSLDLSFSTSVLEQTIENFSKTELTTYITTLSGIFYF